MQISNNYVAVEKYYEPEPEIGDFKTVEVTDESTFKGKIKYLPEAPIALGNTHLAVGDIIVFAKYSPDTHEIEHEGQILKFINTRDILGKVN